MFVLPEDLPLELTPFAFLVGKWEGTGVISYKPDGVEGEAPAAVAEVALRPAALGAGAPLHVVPSQEAVGLAQAIPTCVEAMIVTRRTQRVAAESIHSRA